MSRFAYDELVPFAASLLSKAGMESDKTSTVAEILIEADMLGHDTHGLQLLPRYLEELESGGMAGRGTETVVQQHGAVAVWDGNRLCGVWLTAKALDWASETARSLGVGVVAIRRSHHIACLQAYLTRATKRGQVALVTCSDPTNCAVAPFGGIEPVLSPNPLAVGMPTTDRPILIDMSASITTNAMTARVAGTKGKLAGPWLQDSKGEDSDDPQVLFASPPGSLLPTGGLDHGHKGYNLALIVDCLTQGLSGFGRKDHETAWTASVLVQVFDPALFAGIAAFTDQSGHIANLCRASQPRPGVSAVRIPGDNALEQKNEALLNGVSLSAPIVASLTKAARQYGVVVPVSIERVA